MIVKDPAKVVRSFLGRINAHDVDGLCALMTEDHVFVDSDGTRVASRETMGTGWTTYFQWFPDYRISPEEILNGGRVVAVFGTARGTYAGNGRQEERQPWQIPAAWKAVVRRGRVAEWHVYANVEPVRKQMEGGAP